MFIDLNIPVPPPPSSGPVQSKKAKGKQQQQSQTSAAITFSPAQIAALETRIDLLVHLGYSVFAFNQTIQRKVDAKTHVNVLEPLLQQLRKRAHVVYLKRLTIVLDEESEKGFGLTNANTTLCAAYDLIALVPTTAGSFSLACLTHTQPSPLTAHIISLPLTLPRLPFPLRHTLVRTALKNGAVFEINYVGSLGGEGDPSLGTAGGGEGGTAAKRNWWASAGEVVRVTKGKGILVSGGVTNDSDLRAPRDVANLMSVLGLPQDIAHDGATKIPQSLILRAQTRRTYRAVFSEPRVVIPSPSQVPDQAEQPPQTADTPDLPPPATQDNAAETPSVVQPTLSEVAAPLQNGQLHAKAGALPAHEKKKRPREDSPHTRPSTNKTAGSVAQVPDAGASDGTARKKKKKTK